MTSAYTPLKTIVAMALDENDKSIADFEKLWVLGFRALIHMTYQFAGQTKTERLPVAGNKTVDLPNGCLSWTKIGIVNEHGEINTLRINNALTTFRDTNPNRISDLTPDINSGDDSLLGEPFFSNYYYNGGCYQLFGVGGGVVTYGECKVDEVNRVIILAPDFRFDSILLEYINVPEKDDDYEVMTCMQEAIIAFIKWKLKTGPREEYYAAAVEARRAMPKKKVILQTLNQVLRESDSMKLRS